MHVLQVVEVAHVGEHARRRDEGDVPRRVLKRLQERLAEKELGPGGAREENRLRGVAGRESMREQVLRAVDRKTEAAEGMSTKCSDSSAKPMRRQMKAGARRMVRQDMPPMKAPPMPASRQ